MSYYKDFFAVKFLVLHVTIVNMHLLLDVSSQEAMEEMNPSQSEEETLTAFHVIVRYTYLNISEVWMHLTIHGMSDKFTARFLSLWSIK